MHDTKKTSKNNNGSWQWGTKYSVWELCFGGTERCLLGSVTEMSAPCTWPYN